MRLARSLTKFVAFYGVVHTFPLMNIFTVALGTSHNLNFFLTFAYLNVVRMCYKRCNGFVGEYKSLKRLVPRLTHVGGTLSV